MERRRDLRCRLSMACAFALLLLGFSLTDVSARPAAVVDGDPGTIGACLSQPDGSRVTLPREEVICRGRSGKSFAIKEWFEAQLPQPRLVVVSTRPLPVSELWTVDVTGVLSTFPGTSRDGSGLRQRVLIVSPEDVLVYCDPNGRPFFFPSLKGSQTDWPNKRRLADMAAISTAGVSSLDQDGFPPMPDDPLSGSPTYCATIAEAKSQPDGTAVELQCKPIDSASAGSFVMGEDDTSDTLTTYYTYSVTAGDRLNNVTGTIQSFGGDKVLDIDSGPGFDPEGFVGGAQIAAQGTIAWAKTFPDDAVLPTELPDKVVSRAFPSLGYFYIQEPNRSSGIRVIDPWQASVLQPGDVVTIYWGWTATVDGERVVTEVYLECTSSGDQPTPLGMSNRDLGGGDFNVLTRGPVGGSGSNNVGLFVRAWGEVTELGPGYFYIDDGASVTDGTAAAGVRVSLAGYQPCVPSVGDRVAITGLSGLGTYDEGHGLARTMRVSSCEDVTTIRPAGPPTGVAALASGEDENSLGKIIISWKAATSATGYNVYRGTTSGGEDYEHPINGGTPVTAPTYAGGSTYSFTDTGLAFGQEYFYTVKAIRDFGESSPSEEDSDIPDSSAIPWDTRNAAAITTAAHQLWNPGTYFDCIRAVGPDGTVYCSVDGVLEPGGPVDLGTLQPGSNVLVYTDSTTLALPDDGCVLSGEEQASEGTLELALETKELNPSDGPYRRVRSASGCSGCYGQFAPGWRNQIYMSASYPDDTYWTYLGSRSTIGTGKRATTLDIDAGLQWSEVYFRYNPHLSLKYKRYDGISAILLTPRTWPVTFDTSYWGWIEMCYALQPTGKGSTPMISFFGWDVNWDERRVLLATANPVKVTSGLMKRAHSIALGGPKYYRYTGSRIYGAQYADGMVRSSAGIWGTWGGFITSEQGAYPYPFPSVVHWTIPIGREYYEEYEIDIGS